MNKASDNNIIIDYSKVFEIYKYLIYMTLSNILPLVNTAIHTYVTTTTEEEVRLTI